MRKKEYSNGEIKSYFVKGVRNPCGCGSNLYHLELEKECVLGICNCCNKEIYEVNRTKEEISKADWR